MGVSEPGTAPGTAPGTVRQWPPSQHSVFGGTRTLCFRLPRAAQVITKPGPNPKRGLTMSDTTPSNGARVPVKPHAGGRLQIKLKSLHRGVVVRDLTGRERTVGGDAEPPLGLKKCSRARQGGRGEHRTLPANHGLSRRRCHICRWPSQTV